MAIWDVQRLTTQITTPRQPRILQDSAELVTTLAGSKNSIQANVPIPSWRGATERSEVAIWDVQGLTTQITTPRQLVGQVMT